MWSYNYVNTELYHWGILGQKWGVRRYQNRDGSLTPEGRERYSEEAKKAAELSAKNIGELTNAEIRTLNERKALEESYRKLNPPTYQKVIGFAGATAAGLGTLALLYKNSEQIIDIGKKIAKKMKKKKVWTTPIVEIV